MILRSLIYIVMISEEFNKLVKGEWRSSFLQKLVVFKWVCVKISHYDTLEFILFCLFDMLNHKFGKGFAFSYKVFFLVSVYIDNFQFFVRQKEVKSYKSAIFSVYFLNIF